MSIIDPSKKPIDTDFYIVKDKLIQQTIDGFREAGPIFTTLESGQILATWVTRVDNVSASQTVLSRIINKDGTFVTDELRVSNSPLKEAGHNRNVEENVFVTELANGNVIIGMRTRSDQAIFTVMDSSGKIIATDVQTHAGNLELRDSAPRIIELDDGKFMAVWTTVYRGHRSNTSVYGKIFNEDGTAATNHNGDKNHFKIIDGQFEWNNTFDTPMLKFDYLTDGNIVLGWTKSQDEKIGAPDRAMVTILDKIGKKVTDVELEDASHKENRDATYPVVKALGDGHFVAVWSDYGREVTAHTQNIYYRIFNSKGEAVSNQILVSDIKLSALDEIALDSLTVNIIDDNSFIIGWMGYNGDGSGTSAASVQVDLGIGDDESLSMAIDNVTNTDQFEKATIDTSDNDLTIINVDTQNKHTVKVSPPASLLNEDIDLQKFDISKTQEEVLINLDNNISDYLILDDKIIDQLATNEEIIKIFGDETKDDRVKLEEGWEKITTQETIDGENFNVYQKGTSNIKILINEDVSVNSDI